MKWQALIMVVALHGCALFEEDPVKIIVVKEIVPAADHRDYVEGVATVDVIPRDRLGAAFNMPMPEHTVGNEVKFAHSEDLVNTAPLASLNDDTASGAATQDAQNISKGMGADVSGIKSEAIQRMNQESESKKEKLRSIYEKSN